MIDLMYPVSFSKITDIIYQIVPENGLPPEFVFLKQSDYKKKIASVKSCPHCEKSAIPFYCSFVYSGEKVIFLNSPILYCIGSLQLFFVASDENLIRQRWQKLQNSEFVALEEYEDGVGGKVLRLKLGENIQSALNINVHDKMIFSSEVDVIACGEVPQIPEKILPSAIAFHSNKLPDSFSVKLEPTTRCNFKCDFCYGRHLPQGDLSLENFNNFMQRIPNVKAIELTGEGEPFLNKDIFNMLQICDEQKLWVQMTTNGSLLNEDRINKLLSTGLSSLAISMETFNPIDFTRYRAGGKLYKTLETIKAIVKLRRELEHPIKLGLWVTLLKETLPQVGLFHKAMEDIGFDYLQFQALEAMSSYTQHYSDELLNNLQSSSEMMDLIQNPDTSPVIRDALSSIVSSYQKKSCDGFMSVVMVNWQGYVTPCCMLKIPDFELFGNLKTESLKDIWNRQEYQFFRFCLQHGIILDSCIECRRFKSLSD
jgi:MoaA/NifB/PqqE/SkfB family radical SAM enzyme